MKKFLFFFTAIIAVSYSVLNFNSCTSSTGTKTVVMYDTIYPHYWDPEVTGSSSTLIAVRFPTLQIGIAVGAGGAIARTNDGGNTWNSQTGGGGQDLYGVSFSDVNTGIVVGSNGAAMKTTDGGASWTPLAISAGFNFRNVQMIGPKTAYAIGQQFNDIDNTQGFIYKTTDGGVTWVQLTIAAPGLYGISFIDPLNGWVSGWDGVIFKTTDGGATWTKQTSNIPKTQQVCQISFADATHGIAVGLDGVAGVIATPTSGFIATTSDGGTTWAKVTTSAVDGVWMADPKHAMVVGYNGTIMETADGGATWTTKSVGTLRLLNVFLNDPNNGATIGENGQVFMLGPH